MSFTCEVYRMVTNNLHTLTPSSVVELAFKISHEGKRSERNTIWRYLMIFENERNDKNRRTVHPIRPILSDHEECKRHCSIMVIREMLIQQTIILKSKEKIEI